MEIEKNEIRKMMIRKNDDQEKWKLEKILGGK